MALPMSSGPTVFHLVRHAAHVLLPHTLAGRMQQVPLSEAGRAQAAGLAERLAGEAIFAVVASPVQRAMETAEPLAQRLGMQVVVNAGFQEIDFGAWTGRRFDELAGDPVWADWNRLRALASCPGGETMHAAQSRALSALMGLHAAHGGRTIAVVSHADIIRAILAPALGLPLDRLYRLTIDPASVSTLVVLEGDMRIDRVNG